MFFLLWVLSFTIHCPYLDVNTILCSRWAVGFLSSHFFFSFYFRFFTIFGGAATHLSRTADSGSRVLITQTEHNRGYRALEGVLKCGSQGRLLGLCVVCRPAANFGQSLQSFLMLWICLEPQATTWISKEMWSKEMEGVY